MEMYYAVDEYEEHYLQNAGKNLEGAENSTNLKNFQTSLKGSEVLQRALG